MADTTRDGWFTKEVRTIGGKSVPVWVLTPSHWASMPYFELQGASSAEAQNFENLISGKTQDGQGSVPANDPLLRFLSLQRTAATVLDANNQVLTGAKQNEPANRGTYILIDFGKFPGVDYQAQVSNGGKEAGTTAISETTITGDPNFSYVAGDRDSARPDTVIRVNNLLPSKVGEINVTDRRIPWQAEFGVADWRAAQSMNLIHELLHMGVKEEPISKIPLPVRKDDPTTTVFRFGGHAPYMTVLGRTGAHNTNWNVELSDVQADPITKMEHQLAIERGIITPGSQNEINFWNSKREIYQKSLDAIRTAAGFKTTEDFARVVAKGVETVRLYEETLRLHAEAMAAQKRRDEANAAADADPNNDDKARAAIAAEEEYAVKAQAFKEANAASSKSLQETQTLLNQSRAMVEEFAQTNAVTVILEIAKSFFAQHSHVIGQQFGSALGRYIARNESQLVQVGSSTLLGVIGLNLGQAVEISLRGGAGNSLEAAFEDLPREIKEAGIGVISSLLTAELFDSLGVDGTAGELGQSVFSAALVRVIGSLDDIYNATTSAARLAALDQAFDGFALQVGNIIGGYLGTKLVSEFVHFDTVAGQVGAQLGAAIGATIGAAIFGAELGTELGSFAGPIGAFVGAIVGFIVGGVIGSLFGTTPKSGANLQWNETTQQFQVNHVWTQGGAAASAARSIGDAAAGTLNAIIQASGGTVLEGSSIYAGSYGTFKKDLVFRRLEDGQTTFKTRNFEELMRYSATVNLGKILPRLAGGNVFVKRAMAFSAANAGSLIDLNVLYGNIASAHEYTRYLRDRELIDSLIAAEPSSAFAAGWAITFARAIELGLLRRGASDWVGGWNVFFDENRDGIINGIAHTGATAEFYLDPLTHERKYIFFNGDGEIANVISDTIDSAGKDQIEGTAGDDTIVAFGNRLMTTGVTINGAAPPASADNLYTVKVAMVINSGAGNDVVLAGDMGSDVLGGDGNDTLVGGVLDDWLLGEAGDDRLFAGSSSYQFDDNDAAAVAAALATTSNGDLLDGGDGNDILYGSRGSDFLRGGDGVDTLYGGAGGDVLAGGMGDDRGPNGEARLFGGAGTDQYVFGFGSGRDVIFDESDNGALPGAAVDSIYGRILGITDGTIARDWAGGGHYQVDGSIKGGEDAISFGIGISFQNLILRRSGTTENPGQDLIIRLIDVDPDTHQMAETGDELTIKDWFESTRRVEWLRFANGDEVRLGDIASFMIGTGMGDIIVGSNDADFLSGGDGNDVIFGLDGNDFGVGGRGDDIVAGDRDNDFVSGGSGNDSVIGGAGNDTVFGDGGNDQLLGGQGSDLLVGGRGNDFIVGGEGADLWRYQRGDGRDVYMDDYVDNWDVVWENGTYVNNYDRDISTGVVSKDGVVVFDGSRWIGTYDYDETTKTLRRHLGQVNGALVADGATYAIEFGVGINLQDLRFRRNGDDLQIAVSMGDSDGRVFDQIDDSITIKEWYRTPGTQVTFVFVATGIHTFNNLALAALGTEGADTLTGTTAADWMSGNDGDDVLTGDVGADLLVGHNGADTLRGGADNDVLFGGSDNDLLEGGAGADVLIGGSGEDIASYATTATPGVRVFLEALGTNTRDAIGDTFVDIEGLEGTSGADKLGGTAGANTLRGLGGTDTMYGGAGDDVYEINSGNGQDRIIDAPFVTEEIITSSGGVNTAQFAASWTYLGRFSVNGNTRDCYRLIITSAFTGEEVYRSRDRVDFHYSPQSDRAGNPILRAMPAPSSWPSSAMSNGQWLSSVTTTGNGYQRTREVLGSGNGGDDTLLFGAGISLSDLLVTRPAANDLRIAYLGTSHYVTLADQNDPNRAIESLQLRDGLSVGLTRVVIVGETASAESDFVAGDANANTLEGLAGDDVISGGSGSDTLRGGEGDDTLEGGGGGDVLDGGTDSVSLNAPIVEGDLTKIAGDTIRYVRSTAAVTIDLQQRSASGGHASSDTITLGHDGFASIENVVGSELFNDTLRGDARSNRLAGLGGNDTLLGRGGDDVLLGGLGDDELQGEDGEDNLSGDEGNDRLYGGNQNDFVAGGDGNDTLTGDAGDDILSGGDGGDSLDGGIGSDQLGGDGGDDSLWGGAGDDRLAGGAGDDFIYGGADNDLIAGEAGNDHLEGSVGDDTYYFDDASGADVIVDSAGSNKVYFQHATREQIWLSRSGDDLLITVLGGNTSVTLRGYYSTSVPTRVREIALSDSSLFLGQAGALISAMASASASIPQDMTPAVRALLNDYWHASGRAVPVVVDQSIDNSMGVVVSGSVGAVDHDENIVSYTLETAPSVGSLALNEATGNWTYTPVSNPSGEVRFRIRVTDADGNTALQTINMTLPADPADPPIVTLVQVRTPEAPLTKPTLDGGSWIVHIQSDLTDENSEILELRVHGVPDGISFNTGTNIGGGVWSFGNGPWPSEVRGPAGWSQDLNLSVTATSREVSTGHTYTHDPVPLDIEINARPTDITPTAALSINENSAANAVVGTLNMTDADANETATYALVDGAGGRFTLDANGTLRTGSTGTNFEAATSHVVRVRVTDSGGLSYERNLTVSVSNVNEAPTLSNSTPSYSTPEDTARTGTVGASDPDNNISSYSILTNGTRGVASINATTGAWTYTPTANLYGADSFQIRVTDTGGLSVVQTVTVNVTSVNDAPTNIVLSGAPSSVDERDRPITGSTSNAIALGTLSATDVDAPDAADFASHTFTVSDSRFEVVSGNILRLRAGSSFDFEAGATVSVNVTATDRNGAGLSFTRAFVFTVNDRDDYFYGTASADTITGTAGRNLIYGQGGNDTLTGANANDDIDGGDGNDTLYGLGGNDTLVGGLGTDTLEGGIGNDTLWGGDAIDTLRGQDGNDTINGEAGNDILQGGLGLDQLDGGADSDSIEGNDGDDRLVGNTGDDVLNGGLGGDRFNFGAGTDTLTYASASAGITINLATGSGSAGEATGDIFEDTPEIIIGSGFADTITGSSGNDTIDGGAGNDIIYGGAGNDRLIGGLGDDTLDAQSGDDYLEGGQGNDILIGGTENDTYVIDANSGVDEIRNFDPNGTDIDVVGYQGITDRQLWFERSGNDLIVTAVGTTARTTIKDWYVVTSAADRSNYKIDFFVAGAWQSDTINAEGLVSLMAGYTRPTTQSSFDALLATPAFSSQWAAAWGSNVAPTVPTIANQTINEDGTLTYGITITDDIDPAAGLTISVDAVRTDNYAVQDLSIVNLPTISAADGAGNRTLTVTTKPNASGQVAIKVRATDSGGLFTERVFLLTLTAVADTPTLTVVQVPTSEGSFSRPTLDGGSWAVSIEAALVDPSETLEVRIANVPASLTFNNGTNLGGGVWAFTPAQLTGLRIQGPSTWSQDLLLSNSSELRVTAISREANGDSRTTSVRSLEIAFNARPTDVATAASLTVNENTAANTAVATFTRTDPDSGDTATFTLTNNAGGRFSIDSNGTLRTTATTLNYESGTSHSITVRVTDSGNLYREESYTITVANVNEAPSDIATASSLTFAENTASGTSLATFTRTDPDASDTGTFTLTDNAGGRFTIEPNGTLRAGATAMNFETATSHTITVRVTDAGGLTRDENFTITVTNQNDPPSNIALSATSVNENVAIGTTVGTLSRTDDDASDTATYTLQSNPGNAFRIVGNALQTNAALNFEGTSSYAIVVRVTDAAGATYDKSFTINVVNRNDAPHDITPNQFSIDENSIAGTDIVTLTAADQDAGDTLRFTRLPSSGLPTHDGFEHFDVTLGGLLEATNHNLNYEAAPLLPGSSTLRGYQVRIQVTDAVGDAYIETLNVVVNDRPEAPTDIIYGALGWAEATYGAGTHLYTFTASDPENNIASYTLTNSAGGRFSMDSAGRLYAGSTPLDWDSNYSTNPSTGHRGYQITVQVTDTTSLSYSENVWIDVHPVDEAPTVNTTSYYAVEGTHGGAGQYVRTSDVYGNADGGYARASGSDPEGVTLYWELVGGNTDYVSIDSSGYLHIAQELDYDTAPNLSVTARAWDGGGRWLGRYSDTTISLALRNVEEAPVANFSPAAPTASMNYAGVLSGADPETGAVANIGSNYQIVSAYVLGYYYDGELGYEYTQWEGANDPYSEWFINSQGYNRNGYAFPIDASGNMYTPGAGHIDAWQWWGMGNIYVHQYRDLAYYVNVRVRDAAGLWSPTIGVYVSPTSIYISRTVTDPNYLPPVGLDLDGDGLELVSVRESLVDFAATSDAPPTITGWIGPDDALLALDRNLDGKIATNSEISFIGDLPGATSDLEGLRAFDTNGNGQLDQGDERFGEFLVWQDANQDGDSQAGELRTLGDHDIVSISLERSLTGASVEGATDNVVTATSVFTRGDGSKGVASDVVLAYLGLPDLESDGEVVDELAGPASSPGVELTPADSLSQQLDAYLATNSQEHDAEPVDLLDEFSSVDRSSRDERADARRATAGQDHRMPAEESQQAMSESEERLTGEESSAPANRVEESERRGQAEREPRGRLARGTDLANDSEIDIARPTQTALHQGLDLISKRRLLMIEAMASFTSDEGATDLSLQSSRRVDANTLELLTSVGTQQRVA